MGYRYEENYHADQTKNLFNLPFVPKEKGINLDINLQTWIEPITGRLIKYEDKTIAYYYNITTGERINPWNKFSNKYQEDSLKKQVEIAKKERQKIIIFTKIIPPILSLIIIVLLILFFKLKK